MELKNYQEDIVLNVVDIVLSESDGVEADDAFRYDVAAFALNRLPPRYLMSERGFVRFAALHLSDDMDEQSLYDMARVLVVVNTGVEVVLNRRRKNGNNASASEPGTQELYLSSDDLEVTEIGYWHNLPQVFGRVIATNTGSVLPDAMVTFYVDGRVAEPAEPGWANPAKTVEATKGFYCFWPMPQRKRIEKSEARLTIAIEHEGYKPVRIEKDLVTEGSFEVRRILDDDNVLQVGTTSLEPA